MQVAMYNSITGIQDQSDPQFINTGVTFWSKVSKEVIRFAKNAECSYFSYF